MNTPETKEAAVKAEALVSSLRAQNEQLRASNEQLLKRARTAETWRRDANAAFERERARNKGLGEENDRLRASTSQAGTPEGVEDLRKHIRNLRQLEANHGQHSGTGVVAGVAAAKFEEFLAALHPAPSSEEGEKAVGSASELMNAAQAVLRSWDDRMNGEREELRTDPYSRVYWSPRASMVDSEAVAGLRAALCQTEPQGGGAVGSWWDMSRAPKNGEAVLLRLKAPFSRVAIARWFEPLTCWIEGDMPDEGEERYGIGAQVPDGWMRVPALCQTEDQGGGAVGEAAIAELAEIRADLLAGQGDDDGEQILPDFEPQWSVAAMVQKCVFLLEYRRDVVESLRGSLKNARDELDAARASLTPVSDPKDLEASNYRLVQARAKLIAENRRLEAEVREAVTGLNEAGDGLERIHNSLLSNGPKQASGEMIAYFRDRARTLLARLGKKGDEK